MGSVLLPFLFLALLCLPLYSQESATGTLWDQAVEAMRYNRMSEAASLLDGVVAAEPDRIDARRYLAVAYEQAGRVDEARTVLREGIDRGSIPVPQRARLAFDLAALIGRTGEADAAAAQYGEALQLDPGLASAYLNRGNTLVSTGGYTRAVADYQRYLALRPSSSQRPQIERMIALLTETVAAEEARRQEEEQRLQAEEENRRIAEEEARREEEIARREAEERRQAMLDAVLQSLNTAGEGVESFELENEDIESYEEDLDIVD